MKFKNVNEFPNEMTVSGHLLAVQKEHRKWNDKNTGLPREADIFSLIVQGDYGVLFVRAFSPAFDFSKLPAGEVVVLPIEEYKKDNGMKVATLSRVSA